MSEQKNPIDQEPQHKHNYKPWDMDESQFLVFMHLAQFAGIMVPFGSTILPLVMWLTNKQKSALVDEHGKKIMNWVISRLIYLVISFMLCFIIIGFVPLILFLILSVIFPIIGAVKASNGVVYKYPMSIRFFK